MQAITIKQPWAAAIVHGPKRVENRTWIPRLADREQIAIHAGKRIDAKAWERFAVGHDWLAGAHCGAVVGVARFGGIVRCKRDIVDNVHVRMDEQLDWYDNGIAWVLYDIVPINPAVVVSGTQGLWRLPDDVERLVVRRSTR